MHVGDALNVESFNQARADFPEREGSCTVNASDVAATTAMRINRARRLARLSLAPLDA
jgi:hypothetical protein